MGHYVWGTTGGIPSNADLQREIAALKAKVVALEQDANSLRSSSQRNMLEDAEDGTVIVFDKRFGGPNNRAYTYAAIKKVGRWHVTDTGGRDPKSMAEFLASGVTNLRKMDEPNNDRLLFDPQGR